MKAFRFQGRLDQESPRMARLFELGCVGATEVDGADGPEVVAYFDAAVAAPFPGTWEDVDEVDYVGAYRRDLRAVRAGPLVIAPSHRRAMLRAGEQVVWLDPGTAFGTGHHETTRMALAALGELEMIGLSVLDVGAGSGVLAIAADRLGAGSALGVDVDGATVPVARGNARLNRSRAAFLAGSLDHPQLPRYFDVIVANLYAELHAELMPAYVDRLNPGGRLLLTGILTRLEPTVLAALPPGSEPRWRRAGEWSLVAATAPAPANRQEGP